LGTDRHQEFAMNTNREDVNAAHSIDSSRRRLLGAAGAGVATATLSSVFPGSAGSLRAQPSNALRWGIVGTGGIANSMAPRIQEASGAELAAVSSRRMESAREFADRHGAGRAFDSWQEMIGWDGVDAVYLATPTSVREEIAVAAANAGKHVLGEKPFANLPSLQRITAACRANGVGFMDGTHFVHEPRTAHIKARVQQDIGWPWSVASAFQFGLDDTSNIRLRPDLEPYGAIGDTGWYTMRAAAEYIAAGADIASCEAYMRRHPETGACVSGSGVIRFDDGSTTTWNCGFESGAGVQDLRITGNRGVIKLDDFLRSRRDDHAGAYEYRTGWNDRGEVVVPAGARGATLMFEDFAAMVGDSALLEASIRASERTQGWLDAVWDSALANEAKSSG
jgi:predicted dehydrogenase